jgi:hypothetical protein
MRRWIRLAIRLILTFAIVSVAIYIFLPSTLAVRESITIKCPQRLVFLRLANPKYWISRSKFFYSKTNRFRIDSTAKGKPYIYRWSNRNGTLGFIQLKEAKRYESIIYQVNYEPESDGELIFNLSYQKEATTVEVNLEVDLPSPFWKKVKAYLYYIPVKRSIRNELHSLAMDCLMNSQPLNIAVKEGEIRNFKAFIRKLYIAQPRSATVIDELRKLYESIPRSTIVGHPFIQYANSPYNDTLIVIAGVPVRDQEQSRVPESSLSLFSRVETLYATFSYRKTSFDDVYSLLASKAAKMNLTDDGYPIVFVRFRNHTATMHLPVSR